MTRMKAFALAFFSILLIVLLFLALPLLLFFEAEGRFNFLFLPARRVRRTLA